MRVSRTGILLVAVVLALVLVPSVASAVVVNEYGLTFASQAKCLECHDGTLYGQTVHGRFAKVGLVPAAPAGWTDFRAAGTPPVVGAPNPDSGLPWFSSGGSYAVDLPWITLGDFAGGAATEYIFFSGNTQGDPTVNPWNLVEGLTAEPKPGHPLPIDEGEYAVGAEDPETGLFDVIYGCQRCHMLGTTNKTPNAASTAAVPNPCASIPATYTTPLQWARDPAKTAADFRADPTVAEPGMSIQCEACHGTGFAATANTTKHWNSGTQISERIPAGTVGPNGPIPATTISTLGQSQVCGQCHGSYTNVAGTLGIYGYTPNLPMRLFVDINGVSGGASYTYTPTEAEFMATPTKYFLFPNGSNARGSHYYYNEWATSAHAYRGALGASMGVDPDVMIGGTHGHYNPKTSAVSCSYCHTGEGYLWSKTDTNPGFNPDPAVEMWEDFTPTQSNTGYMGQECVVCHNPHPSGVGTPDTIRQPDPAGVRSAKGLATGNASMCEDCHNWQIEVQNLAPLAPNATSTRPVSHPQRETLHGRSVMFDVPNMGEFMPGAKCQECHMPKTNRSANRFSHGMHIMKPGDAERWMTAASALYAAGYNGEDSCTPCHAGETRDELQANLDKWQSDAAALDAAAAAAVTAAKTRAEYATAAGVELVGRANVNEKAFVQDGSGGAHNPPYEQAGLKVAKKMADSVGGAIHPYASSRVTIGSFGYVAAHMVNGDGTAAVGAKVALLHYVGGVWVDEGSTVSDAHGNVAFRIGAGTLGTQQYKVRWDRCDNDVADKYSSVVSMVVVKITPKITIFRSSSSILLGRTFRLYGAVSPSSPGKVMTIQAKRGTGSWFNLTTTTLSSTSSYSKYIKPASRGTWYYRVRFPGTATISAAYSASVSVIVR